MTKLPISIFISYRTKISKSEAGLLRNTLSNKYETVFMDDVSLVGGGPFPEQLLDMIRRSDVLIVTIGEGTSQSGWVRREIDVARGLKIMILPVVHISDETKYQSELTNLGLSNIQANFITSLTPHEREEIEKAIETRAMQTRDHQRELAKELDARLQPRPAAFEQSHEVFQFKKPDSTLHPTTVHVTVGDVTNVRNIDVLVNSENTDMQMARFFEYTRISSILRNRGATTRKGLLSDTIQDEINAFLSGSQPVPPTTVVPTSAGLNGSGLRMINRARYIFHVASVMATPEGLRPLMSLKQIEECVFHCLAEIKNVNAAKGVISPEGTEQREEQKSEQDSYSPIRSILFPLFGTGHGGRPIKEVANCMVRALANYLDDYEIPELEEIHLSVFLEDDVKVVLDEFAAHPQYI